MKLSYADYQPVPKPIFKLRITLDSFPSYKIPEHFRFRSKTQIISITNAFEIPNIIRLDNGAIATDQEAVLISLYHYHYPTNFCQMEELFHRDYSICSRIFNWFVFFMSRRHGHLLHSNLGYWAPKFEQLSRKVTETFNRKYPNEHNNPNNIVAVLDTTVLATTRPGGPKEIQETSRMV